ncbi:DHH family phosphoesterase [Anaerotignum sp.]
MDDRSDNRNDNNDKKKKGESNMVGAAAVVLCICICFIIDTRLGIGAIAGAVAGFFAWSLLGDGGAGADEEEEDRVTFLDTAVLQRNFPIPQHMPIPYAVLDIRGHILMVNETFAKEFPDMKKVVPVVEQMKKTGTGKHSRVEVEGKFYDAMLNQCEVVEENGAVGAVLNLTMVDISRQYELEQQLDSSETVIGLLFLDNYEDVVDSLAEDRQPLLSAVVDRKLTQFAIDANGVMKKLEKDRYIFLLSKGDLEALKEKKFDIMNTIREISVGEHIPVTMSMGIGVGGGSLEDAMQSAKAALDLALGRGGDQILIKEGEKYLFYGAKAGEMGRNSRIRARVKADALWELMGEASSIFVMGHRNADLDSLGSCMGICAIARAMGKKCSIMMNDISVGIKHLYANMAENGHYETALIKDAEALKMMDEKSLVIVVDTHRSSIVESPQVLAAAKKIVIFDHHRKSTDFIDQAVLIYHEPYASSTAELITEMIQHIGKKIKLKSIEADALLAGITVDTKNFAVKTGAITFETAGFLRRNGADSIRVRMLFQNDMDSYKAKATAIRDAELFHDCMAISVCPSDVENSMLTAAQAADDLMNVIGIKASFVCSKVGDTIYVSARSFGDINVQRIMEKLGGGGHFTVSGAQLKGCTTEEAKEQIRNAIEEYLKEETV